MTLKLSSSYFATLQHLSDPWSSMAGPWDQWHGVHRLRWLKDLPSTQGPVGLDLGPDPSTSEFLRAFRNYAVEAVDPELLDDRKDVWKILGEGGPGDLANPPDDWWCLKASQDLMEYKHLLMRDLKCDHESVGYFVRLVRIGKPEGYMECLRILHHLVKDKDLARTFDASSASWMSTDPHRTLAEQNSKWLKNACMEALDALANPEDWEQVPAQNAKGASKGSWASFNPFAIAKGPGDKGKGKGKDFGTFSKQGWRG